MHILHGCQLVCRNLGLPLELGTQGICSNIHVRYWTWRSISPEGEVGVGCSTKVPLKLRCDILKRGARGKKKNMGSCEITYCPTWCFRKLAAAAAAAAKAALERDCVHHALWFAHGRQHAPAEKVGTLEMFCLGLAVPRELGKVQIPHYQLEVSWDPLRSKFIQKQESLWQEKNTAEAKGCFRSQPFRLLTWDFPFPVSIHGRKKLNAAWVLLLHEYCYSISRSCWILLKRQMCSSKYRSCLRTLLTF